VSAYPTIDEEKLTQLDPAVVIHLLPAPQAVQDEARRRWRERPNLTAVRTGRVHVVDDYFILQPGLRVADTAERLAELLHLSRATMKRATP
jgi:iron complex transport system substrate-binding protein